MASVVSTVSGVTPAGAAAGRRRCWSRRGSCRSAAARRPRGRGRRARRRTRYRSRRGEGRRASPGTRPHPAADRKSTDPPAPCEAVGSTSSGGWNAHRHGRPEDRDRARGARAALVRSSIRPSTRCPRTRCSRRVLERMHEGFGRARGALARHATSSDPAATPPGPRPGTPRARRPGRARATAATRRTSACPTAPARALLGARPRAARRRWRATSAAGIVSRLEELVAGHSGKTRRDDIAMLVLRVSP